ncbi:hypothetical protein E2C01_035749 [Portunus trituberculatus]|uniref:Uncharacterized protein n=1 Tax=Portunus trituberculatus TaxID=210409 RepID=A0A5B7F965_PORTR|nr:hypothetical protein [Portunus trituberculatus]
MEGVLGEEGWSRREGREGKEGGGGGSGLHSVREWRATTHAPLPFTIILGASEGCNGTTLPARPVPRGASGTGEGTGLSTYTPGIRALPLSLPSATNLTPQSLSPLTPLHPHTTITYTTS